MPPAILTRLSKSLRQKQKNITCHSDAKRQSEGETCPICWKNLPKKPQCLPCNHEFCKGCIVDLREHANSVHTIPKCPICRGPLEQANFKRVYKRACHHENIASTLIGLGAAPVEANTGQTTTSSLMTTQENSLTFLNHEVIREYGLAAKKFEECLNILDDEASRTLTPKEESKHKQFKVATLMKLQHCLRYSEVAHDRRISLLKEAILLSSKPIPEAHLQLGKIFLQDEEDSTDLAIGEFQSILKLAEQSRLVSGSKKAKKLRGRTHFQMAMAYQDENMIAEAANHYDLAHKYKSCWDYYMASKCFSLVGNLPKAIEFCKLALEREEDLGDARCDTHLLLISIYEKLFLVEQLEGSLQESKHYKYHQDIEQYCSSLIKAKKLASNSQERSELYLRLDTLQGLIPWKLDTIQEHFPPKTWLATTNTASTSCRTGRSAAFTEDSENTFEMGEMEDNNSMYSNSLYSTSFDHDCKDHDGENHHGSDHDDDNNDGSEDEDSDYYDEEDDDEGDVLSKDVHSDDDTGDEWTEDSHDIVSVDPVMEDDVSLHDDDDEEKDGDDDQDDDSHEDAMDDSDDNHDNDDEEEDFEPETNDHVEVENGGNVLEATQCIMQEPETDDEEHSEANELMEDSHDDATPDGDDQEDQPLETAKDDEQNGHSKLGAANDDNDEKKDPIPDLVADSGVDEDASAVKMEEESDEASL
ncbi:unnamed protein product [Cylindrotheca closterium]|uniref:RING-type domain-containing protein n=1 Tax=Cylindrotheca closterium TaxID=2856 RepID=A0AAD2G5T8_9STRA|nr:unnamed protein product [Cylindrotheca closterium]